MEYKKIFVDNKEIEVAISIDENEIEQNYPPRNSLEDTIEIKFNEEEHE